MRQGKFFRASVLLKAGENKQFAKMIAEIYLATDWMNKDYPNYCAWYYGKILPGIFSGEREMAACYVNDQVAAVAILKKDDEERKICTLFVKPEYQKRGIATKLLKECFAWLGTTRPLITIADYKLNQFTKIITKYKWVETSVLAEGYYNNHSREHVFNG